jgi:hypothetical protein
MRDGTVRLNALGDYMISILALLYLDFFIRQSATSPPGIEWPTLLLTSGVVIAIVGVIGNIVLDRVKTINAIHLADVNTKNSEAAQKASELVANAAAQRQQDTDLTAAHVELTKAIGRLSVIIATNAEIEVKNQKAQADAAEDRRKLMSGLGIDMVNLSSEMDEHRQESKGWVEDIQTDIETLRKDFATGIDKIINQLALMPTSEAQEAANRHIIEELTKLAMKFEQLEQRIPTPPIAETPPKANGMTADESKPQ